MVTPKYLQWSDFFTKVEPTVTVSESLRRLSFEGEGYEFVLLPFKFSLFRQKYSSNLYIYCLAIFQEQSQIFYHYRKLNKRQHTVIHEQVYL